MQKWERVEPTTVTKVGWRTVVSKTFILPSGETTVFDTFYPERQEFVIVIALTQDKKVIVARQFRPGPEVVFDDFPGGFVDEGEIPQEAGVRELAEETGYVSDDVEYLGEFCKDAYANATWHVILARGCVKKGIPGTEGHEFVEVDLLTIDEFMKRAKAGRISDHGAVLMAYDTLMEERQ
jgi:ADP-ribose pyrophosphatase